MKRLITITLMVVFFVSSYSFVLAKPNKEPRAKAPKKNVRVVADENGEEEPLSPSAAAHARNTIRKLNIVVEETDDPEIIEEIEEVTEEQEDAEEGAEEALGEINKRSNVLKFLIGPDYKNLGQLRSEIVQIRNNIRKLEQIQTKTGEGEEGAIGEAIGELQQKQVTLQATMGEKLSGFSLFGWLSRWLSGYNSEGPTESPVPSATPTGSAEPTGTPEATPSGTPSATPTESPVATESPEPTVIPTIEPTAAPQ